MLEWDESNGGSAALKFSPQLANDLAPDEHDPRLAPPAAFLHFRPRFAGQQPIRNASLDGIELPDGARQVSHRFRFNGDVLRRLARVNQHWHVAGKNRRAATATPGIDLSKVVDALPFRRDYLAAGFRLPRRNAGFLHHVIFISYPSIARVYHSADGGYETGGHSGSALGSPIAFFDSL